MIHLHGTYFLYFQPVVEVGLVDRLYFFCRTKIDFTYMNNFCRWKYVVIFSNDLITQNSNVLQIMFDGILVEKEEILRHISASSMCIIFYLLE